MIISFAETQKQILERTKSETRRLWKAKTAARFKRGLVAEAWTRLPYRGGRHFADIRATADAFLQPLGQITTADAEAEGFPEMTGADFADFFIRIAWKNQKVRLTLQSEVWVARFEVIKVYD